MLDFSLKSITYRSDCKHFRGDIPCVPHKETGVHCDSCQYYTQSDGWILLIKLGAVGDVIRTTPLLHRLRQEFPSKSILWLTYSPDVVPADVERVMTFNAESILVLQSMHFDLCINLDKDIQACALASSIDTDEHIGFVLENGKPAPADPNAEHKFLTGLFDDVNQANTKSYVEEIFEICGYTFSGEEYIINPPQSNPKFENLRATFHTIIGLNTGCGDRWTSRRWGTEQWTELIQLLQAKGYTPLLLGGKQEHELNTALATATGAQYAGYFSLQDFIAEVDICSAIVSLVTMGMHVAIGLKKPLILLNNIFNPNEFELYGRGEIIQPSKQCHCFFRGTCTNTEYQCMDFIAPETVAHAVENSLMVKES